MSTGLSTERDAWLQRRRKRLGASEAPSICGIRTKPTRLQIWLAKTGEVESEEPTEAMRWGLKLEPIIAEAYMERTGLAIVSTQVEATHPHFKWMGATLDGVDSAGDIVEFKAVGRWGARGLGDDGDAESLPEAWVIQGQHQMCVADRRDMAFAVFIDMGLRVYRLVRNDDLINDLITLEQEFWASVQSGTPPAEFQPEDVQVIQRHFDRNEGTHLVFAQDNERNAIVDFLRASREIKEKEHLRDECKASLLFAMGNASTAECGPYRLKRRVVNVKERTQTIKASHYIRFTCSNGEYE